MAKRGRPVKEKRIFGKLELYPKSCFADKDAAKTEAKRLRGMGIKVRYAKVGCGYKIFTNEPN